MLNRFARGPFCQERSREVCVSIGEVIAQLDRFPVMRDGLLFPPFSGERDPEQIMEERRAEMERRLAVAAAIQGAFKMANGIVDPVTASLEEREIVIADIVVRRHGERMSPKRLGALP